jgi:hypothetical protein
MTPSGLLVGHWKLVSFTEERGAEWVDVFGSNPKGYINYSASGYMSAVLARSDRPLLSGPWSQLTDHAKAQNFDGLVAYAGRYTDHGERVVHHVEVCWIPNWEGRDLERFITYLPGDRVLLRTPQTRFGRTQPVQEIVWERAPAPLAAE